MERILKASPRPSPKEREVGMPHSEVSMPNGVTPFPSPLERAGVRLNIIKPKTNNP